MKDRKKVFFAFAMYDYTGIERYLEKQAKEGWMLERFNGIFIEFRKIKPKDIRFSVTYFKKASAYDLKPSKEQVHYMDLCEYSGWKYVASAGEMQVFCSGDKYATPLETDSITKVNNIHKTMKKIFIPSYIVLAIVLLFNVINVFSGFLFDTIYVLANDFLMLSGICSLLALVLVVIEFTAYFRWNKKALKKAEEGIFVESSGRFNFQYLASFITSVGLIFMMASIGGKILIYVGIGIAVTIWLIVIGGIYCRELLKKIGLSKRANRIMTATIFAVMVIGMWGVVGFVSFKAAIAMISKPAYTYKYKDTDYEVYNDEIPFRIEDFCDTDYDEYSTKCTKKSSLLVEYIDASQTTRLDAEVYESMEYTMVKVKNSFVYDLVKNTQIEELKNRYSFEGDIYSVKEIDGGKWNANEAYQLYRLEKATEYYILVFDDVIVEIQFGFDWELTDEQKLIIGEKLHNLN